MRDPAAVRPDGSPPARAGAARFGGVKRLNPFLSGEQRALLESLPALVATLAAVADYETVVAQIVIERGRALAERTGATWPAPLEDATRAHLERELGIVV